MKKLIIFLFTALSYFTATSQVIQPQRVWVQDNLQPPLDTIKAPIKLGEIRARVQDSSFYMSISLSGKKWIRTGSFSAGGGGSDGNNFVTGINYNTGSQLFTLSRSGLGNLTTSIPIPVYNGSETKIQAGSGGILVTGIGTTSSPYVVSGTLDGNNYPTNLSFIGNTLTMDRNGLGPLSVNVPTSPNNYPTSLTYSGNTLTLGRNGLSSLSTTITQDGNNFVTSATYGSNILTLNRSGLTPVTVTIPSADTNILSTKLWRQKGIDSLAALTKSRYFYSSDNSISVVKKIGTEQDSIDITHLPIEPAAFIKSSNATVSVSYNLAGDTVDLSVGPATVDTFTIATRFNKSSRFNR